MTSFSSSFSLESKTAKRIMNFLLYEKHGMELSRHGLFSGLSNILKQNKTQKMFDNIIQRVQDESFSKISVCAIGISWTGACSFLENINIVNRILRVSGGLTLHRIVFGGSNLANSFTHKYTAIDFFDKLSWAEMFSTLLPVRLYGNHPPQSSPALRTSQLRW